MRRLPFALLLLTVGTVGVAQVAPSAPPTTRIPKSEVTPQPLDPGSPPRAISADLSAKIGATTPRFSPPKITDSAKPEGTLGPDLREIDKPRNTIIRLPQHIVQGDRYPVLKDRDLLTPRGKLNLAMKRYPGLRFGSLPFLSNNGIAMFMLEEDLRLERISEMMDLAGLYDYTDPKTGRAMRDQTTGAFIRPSNWIDLGGSRALSKQR